MKIVIEDISKQCKSQEQLGAVSVGLLFVFICKIV